MNHIIDILHIASALLLFISIIFFTVGYNRIKQQNRKLIEYAQEMKNSEERYRLFVEKSPESIIVTNRASKILYVNPAGVQSMEAKSKEEILGKSLYEFILPCYHSIVEERKGRLFGGEALTQQSYRLKTKQNNIIDFEISSILTTYQGEMCCLVIGEDITYRKKMEREVEASKGQYQSLVEMTPDVISVLQDGEIAYINQAGLNLLGADRLEEVIGKPYLKLLSVENSEWLDGELKRLAASETVEYMEYTFFCTNGPDKKLEISSDYIQYSGRKAMLCIGRDVTERKKEQEELITTKNQLQTILEQYRVLQQSLDHFSHDLFKVMKISDLEERLIFELKEILKVENIFIIEIDDRLNLYRGTGGTADFHESILQYFEQSQPTGEMVTIEQGSFVKIGETNGRIFLLGVENEERIADSLPQRIWLQTISRYVSVLYENLYTIEDLANELEESYKEKRTPTWMLRLLFLVAEKERMKLSADLHDDVLQNQIFWYRKLEALRSDSSLDSTINEELIAIENGLLDVIQQIRVTCNDLRPPYLKKLGLIKALENLFSYTKQNADYQIEFNYSGLKREMNEEEMITLYRVTQELLANARKHSQATKVEFTLSSMDKIIYFNYQDNGIGMELNPSLDSFDHIGLNGIQKRVDSLEGEMELYSAPGKGVNLLITIPAKQTGLQNMVCGVFK